MTTPVGQSAGPCPDENECSVCNKEVGNKEKALNCDICNRWIHIECGKVNQSTYSTLKKLNTSCQGMKWLCEKCEKCFGKI